MGWLVVELRGARQAVFSCHEATSLTTRPLETRQCRDPSSTSVRSTHRSSKPWGTARYAAADGVAEQGLTRGSELRLPETLRGHIGLFGMDPHDRQQADAAPGQLLARPA